jgi:hypothetical protein
VRASTRRSSTSTCAWARARDSGSAPRRPPIVTTGSGGLVVVGKDAVIPPGICVGRSSVIGVGNGPDELAGVEIAAGTIVPNRSWFEDAL